MAKKIINIFFLLIFITQVFPVRQVGRILFQASLIEELPEKGPEKSTAGFEDHTKHFLTAGTYWNFFQMSNNEISYIHHSETLPVFLAGDVQTPPPDFSL